MPKIKVQQIAKGPMAGYGCRMWMNDREVKDITSISLDIEADAVVKASVGVLATESINIEADDAQVVVNVTVLPGYMLLMTDIDGVKRYTAIPERTIQ